jgi:hypothetical protein
VLVPIVMLYMYLVGPQTRVYTSSTVDWMLVRIAVSSFGPCFITTLRTDLPVYFVPRPVRYLSLYHNVQIKSTSQSNDDGIISACSHSRYLAGRRHSIATAPSRLPVSRRTIVPPIRQPELG